MLEEGIEIGTEHEKEDGGEGLETKDTGDEGKLMSEECTASLAALKSAENNRPVFEEDTTLEGVLVSVASETETRDRAASFLQSSLRARLYTVTVVEVFKKIEEEDAQGKEEAPFRVLEDGMGDLTICHESSIDCGNWSSEVTVNHRNVTLEEELESVTRRDIVDVCKDGANLSPMSVSKISHSKRVFGTAVLKTKGRVVKALFKRKDD